MTAVDDAQLLFKREHYAILSTHSQEMPGFPFGSVVPYCANKQGEAVILISRLAQHTKNLLADNKCSVLISDSQIADRQAGGRLTLMCEAEPLPATSIADRFYRYFPSNQGYHEQMDFDFFKLKLVKARMIVGFGKIHWIDADSFLQSSPFEESAEAGIVNHMNQDHMDAIEHYCELFGIAKQAGDPVSMVGIDATGMHLRVAAALHRVEFDRSISTAQEAREVLVALAKKPVA